MFTHIFCEALFDCSIGALYHCIILRMISCCWCPVHSQLLHMFLKRFDWKLLPLLLWRFAGQPNLETHTFTKALATVESSWLLMGIASYDFVNWSPIKRMYLFPLDSSKGPIMFKATCQNGWLGFHVVRLCMCFWCGDFFWQHTSQELTHSWTSFFIPGQ